MYYERLEGVGIINFAYWLARNDSTYSNPNLELVHEYAEAWSYYLIKASVDLAEEFGKCGKSDETKYDLGIMPIDTYKKDVDDLVEPEMVNPKSELYENHPDWVVKQPKRGDYMMRNQLVLDLSNPKVQDFVFGVIDDLFTKNPNLAYIKWDCNSVIYNAYSAYEKDQSNFYVDYVKGPYVGNMGP